TTPMTTITTTIMTTTTTKTAFQCYECSGADCGREGAAVMMICPKCMVQRNPQDESKSFKKKHTSNSMINKNNSNN
ncbi:unnamed protein product, partial [Rotaria magnacalcarata]